MKKAYLFWAFDFSKVSPPRALVVKGKSPVFLVLIFIGLIVSVYFIDSHPIFFAIALVIFLVILVVGAVLSDVFTDISSSPEFANQTATFSMTTFALTNLPIIILGMGGIVLVMLYAKAKGIL